MKKAKDRSFNVLLLVFALCLMMATRDRVGYSQTIGESLSEAEIKYLNARKAEAAAIPDPPEQLPLSKKGNTELQYMIQLGEEIIRRTNTHPLTASYIQENGLTCSSCHLDGGKKKAIASTFIGSAAAFPAFNLRDDGVITLQDRINSCFMRSMNGMRMPANSEPLLAMVSYISWLSEGIPIQMNPDRPVSIYNDAFVNPHIRELARNGGGDAATGQSLYSSKCALCHGEDGRGRDSQNDGHFEVPPVWGPKSYNEGAGMANHVKGASWVQFNMPPGQEFSLGNGQALNIMTYVNSRERPPFVENEHLPAGGRNYGGKEIVYHYGRNLTEDERSARVPVARNAATTSEKDDGAALYAANCAGCHGDLQESNKRGRSADQIRRAISSIDAMKNLKTLANAEIEAIAQALAKK